MDNIMRGLEKQIQKYCDLPILYTSDTTSTFDLKVLADSDTVFIEVDTSEILDTYGIIGMTVLQEETREAREIVGYNEITGEIELAEPFSETILENDILLSEFRDHIVIKNMYAMTDNNNPTNYKDVLERYEIKLVVYNDADNSKSVQYKRELMLAMDIHSFPEVDENGDELKHMIYINEGLRFIPRVTTDVANSHRGRLQIKIKYRRCKK